MIKTMADSRREYGSLTLDPTMAKPDPLHQFQVWFEEILTTDNYDPTAMLLSTVDEKGTPDARVVLLKGISDGKFIFFTNYQSTKAQQMAEHPQVALTFFWPFLARQVRIKGEVEKIAAKESDAYFNSRPRLSQLAAMASNQSQVLGSRFELEAKMNALLEKYGQEPIVRPEQWGGYAVDPVEYEFWQGRDNRLHDRLRYFRTDQEAWQIERLAP